MSKRFWTSAAVAAVPGGYAVLLDGKPLRLPGGVDLTVTAPALAEAIAAEWQDAGACFGPDDVPLTGLAGAAQERVAANRAGMVESLIGYARADLLCYRAAQPAALAAAQHAAWQPWLDWAAQRHGAALRVTTELRAIDQPRPAWRRCGRRWRRNPTRIWPRWGWRSRRWAVACWGSRWPMAR
jgi:chaperone required for assembly of F1-ATPase